jgi:predicted TIM-barrel fold metal-dependent hydrolase
MKSDLRLPHNLSRRALLTGLGVTGAGAVLQSGALRGQTPPNGAGRLDFHHHFGSPRWIKKIVDAKRLGWQRMEDYTPAKSLEAMDKAGVATAFLSCTEPGVWVTDDFAKERQEAISLARDMNEFGARMVADHKGRFGLFAVLPLPDIDATLREIEYALDTLHADGVGLLTSYGDKYLGDKAFEPVFDELNRRNAVVYTHPTDAPCCHNLLPITGPATIEWQTDTSRSIFSMIADGAGPESSRVPSRATRYANIKLIWSHAGGTLIGLMNRFLGAQISAATLAQTPPMNSRLYHLRRFYYDIAQSTNVVQMQALKGIVGASQIVFGADFPYFTIVDHVEGLKTCGFSAEELRGIDRNNGLRILPKYKV